ncbi:MAG TPA: hypothetical protein PK175_07740 [Syntrophales bacterium]|jgi:DNA-binding Lrp family transcriptional regulator|nr:hypothetical protein [Syntrophales bacterium]HON22953.1 hypothetical protein [Syntrophales bacterium]HOU78322.1 hypothetical protein [Syntrophales bacterium]HPC31528.1 hypothetical protein [Syntrophales bacterium]HQG34745.1 hypothetical protein [Syntrophales bacterium]
MNLSINIVFSDHEKALARLLQGDIPAVGRPFQEIAAATGQTEAVVLDLIERLRSQGVMRKFGAVLRHHELGFVNNAMVVWAVPANRVEAAGRLLAAHREITHCYERTPPFLGKYNLFSMLHGKADAPDTLIGELAGALGGVDYLILRSREELKKISMEYFI